MTGYNLLVLSADDVRKSISMKDAIKIMESAFLSLSQKEASVPQRIHIEHRDLDSLTLYMPASNVKDDVTGVKVVSVANQNPLKNIPRIHGLVLLKEASTGIPLAVMEGSYITALRTGAASGIAAKLLANPESKTVGIFGAGIQGRTQLEAIICVRDIEKAYVFDINNESINSYIDDMNYLNIPILQGTKSQIRECDIICTATTSSTPVFEDEDIKDGAHINAVGSYNLKMREIPGETITKAKVFVDSMEACLAEAGEFLTELNINPERLIDGEIGDVISGKLAGRTAINEITMFKSVGNAIQDIMTADFVYQKAKILNLGSTIKM